MIRASISLLHTVLGVASTTGGLWLVAQATANARWEQAFYHRTDDVTSALMLAGFVAASLGISQILAAVGWFLGSPRGGWTLVGLSLLLGLSSPPGLLLLLATTSSLILLDLMVQAHHARGPSSDADDP